MIVNINETQAIWFGYVLSPEKEISYEDAVYLLMESQGYTKEMIDSRRGEIGGDTLLSRMGKSGKPPTSEEKFIQSTFFYLSEFSADKHKKKVASLIDNHHSFKNSAKGLASFIYQYIAPK